MEKEDSKETMDRRKILRTTGAAVGSGLVLGATGTAAAASNGTAKGNGNERNCKIEEISREGGTIVTLVEVFGEKFLFREAAAHRKAKNSAAQSGVEARSNDVDQSADAAQSDTEPQPNTKGQPDDTFQPDVATYEATETGHPVEFQKISSSVSTSDINSDGSIQVQDVDFTPENFVKRYDVDTKKISDSCGDIAFGSHHALEFHFEGGGAFSSIGISGLAGVLCYAAAATTAIPTGGLSGALAAGVCSMLTAAVDAAIDVDMIPNNVEISTALWDQDENQFLNTSPTIAVGIEPGWEVQWYEMTKVGEYDVNLHLGL